MRWFRVLVCALVVVSAACGGKHVDAHKPTSSIVQEIELAEEAELKREHLIARAHYEKAVADARSPADVHFARREFGETLATWGEFAEARTQLETSVAAVPDDPKAWQMLGVVRHKLGDIPGAFAALEKSKALAPHEWIPRQTLAALHWSHGEGRNADPDPAKADAHRAAALAEYRGMLELDLPDRLREKVEWAVSVLSKPRVVRDGDPSATAPPE